jgi:hypothetical protein
LTTDEIAHVHQHYKRIAHRARLDLKQGKTDTGTPEANIGKVVRQHVQPVDVHPEHSLQRAAQEPNAAEEIAPSDVARAAIDQHDQDDAD